MVFAQQKKIFKKRDFWGTSPRNFEQGGRVPRTPAPGGDAHVYHKRCNTSQKSMITNTETNKLQLMMPPRETVIECFVTFLK